LGGIAAVVAGLENCKHNKVSACQLAWEADQREAALAPWDISVGLNLMSNADNIARDSTAP
jgi:hypothetical protein